MARMPRLVVPNYPHHVTQRGNRKQQTFFNDSDYLYYLDLLSEFAQKSGTQIWAYCLMPNHVHLVMVPTHEDGLRSVLGETHRRYTRRINFREGWRGHLWQERFHSFVMDEQHLIAATRYVENNPVVAGLCDLPEEWKWSSAMAHIKGEDNGIVSVKPMLARIGNWSDYLSGVDSNDVLDLIQQHGRTGRPLGDGQFIRDLEAMIGRKLTPRKAGRKPA